MMNKIKTLLGERNTDILFGAFVRYTIMFLMFMFINPWIVGAIAVVSSWFILFCLDLDKKDQEGETDPDLITMVLETFFMAVPAVAAESFVVFFASRNIGLFSIPALSLLFLIISMLIFDDDEPRTKTDSPYEEKTGEEQNNETYSVVGEAQDFHIEYFGSDPDGNSAIEKLKGNDWNTGEADQKEGE